MISNDEIVKLRLVCDERLVKNAAKSYAQLCNISENHRLSENISGFQILIDSCRNFIAKHERICETNQEEMVNFETERKKLDVEMQSHRETIISLRKSLEDAKQDRKNKAQYDEIAEEILKLPSRDITLSRIERVREERQALDAVLESHKSLIQYRMEKIRSLISSIDQLQKDFEQCQRVDESEYVPADDEDEQTTSLNFSIKTVDETEDPSESIPMNSTRPGSASSSN